LNRRKALNEAQRLNPSIGLRAGYWNDWNWQRHLFAIGTTGTLELLEPTLAWNVLNGAKRLNDWNAWNGLIPVMNGAKRWNDWNGFSVFVRVWSSPIALILMTVQPQADQPSAETGADLRDPTPID
jgi:hypothetical protein